MEEKEKEKIPVRTDPRIKLQEMTLDVIARFQGTDEMNTEITPAQRVILVSLEQIARDFMPLSRSLSTNPDPEFWKFPMINTWIDRFRVYGLPVGRKGRTETGEVLKSFLEAQKEQAKLDAERSRLLK